MGNENTAKRADYDFYATPSEAVYALVDNVELSREIWEPACGTGSISKILKDFGFDVFSTDLIYRGYGETDSVDFLKCRPDEPVRKDIVTNPPYNLALDFVKRAVEIVDTGFLVCMLLKLTFLEGQKRREFFRRYPPQYVCVFSKRIGCARNGDFEAMKKQSSAVAYAWFIWKKGFQGEPKIRWI
ncbi:MAG: NAD(P)-dependent oxidoreductase [Dialister sp.]|uniref:hypothetical protein n=1 Tax=Dialister sp. TaxID=1955814 RepID=UPI001D643E59|nr:hypothetical protein [Dialister sp.]MBS6715314.1 NAD(P)-dependent oxidoreductase [Dialister sp.]